MIFLFLALIFVAYFSFGDPKKGNPFGNGMVTRGGKGFVQQECERELEEFYDSLEDGQEFRSFNFKEWLDAEDKTKVGKRMIFDKRLRKIINPSDKEGAK